ncbi:exosporium leader peptide-containing protein, partial [Bacillus cereus group sp. BceL013]|uniref:exosporium leader peptide-containing protein n=1 Tax=Bacillus cereus group sp. BceL013 TaxID=3445215 RepID=UPI00404137A3
MSRKDRFNSPKIKSEISISPDLVGPTFPPIPSFTLPTGKKRLLPICAMALLAVGYSSVASADTGTVTKEEAQVQ